LKNELLQPPSNEPYNFTKSLERLDLQGQEGQAQKMEDQIFRGKIMGEKGFFIEAGAYDGEIYSNSLLFELKKGWNGLLVEPNPDAFHELTFKVGNK
jgi:hypothetical protein